MMAMAIKKHRWIIRRRRWWWASKTISYNKKYKKKMFIWDIRRPWWWWNIISENKRCSLWSLTMNVENGEAKRVSIPCRLIFCRHYVWCVSHKPVSSPMSSYQSPLLMNVNIIKLILYLGLWTAFISLYFTLIFKVILFLSEKFLSISSFHLLSWISVYIH